MILFDAAAKYLDDLIASVETIAPQKWRADVERLTAYKDSLYLRMKAMRENFKAVEEIRKAAGALAKSEKTIEQKLDL
ncbi:MAG: hypothetical protein PHT62_11040 [Desulfotomaculaceae bacterium]|nr:hypothetical protein [Desulfotomaculaceae bacterium]